MFKKNFPLVVGLFVFAFVVACSKGVPPTTAAAVGAPSPQPVQQQAPPPPTQPPPVQPTYAPNCAGCIQLSEGDTIVIIRAQRSMMSLQGEWQQSVKEMNDKFSVQQKIISAKLDEVKKAKNVPATDIFDYQNLQFVPAPAASGPQQPKK